MAEWLTELINEYGHLKIHVDYHDDLIILERLLTGFPLLNQLSAVVINLDHLDELVNSDERETCAHHALWDAKDLYQRWQYAAEHGLLNKKAT